MERSELKLRIFGNFALQLSTLSVCKRAKVGCVIVPRDLTSVVSIGYNGPASGEDNDKCTGQAGNCLCLHAECNAIIKLVGYERDLTLLCTTSPCVNCAAMIINCRRISEVKYYAEYRDPSGVMRLLSAGIRVDRMED